MTTVRPFFWFDGDVAAAAAFYTRLFDDGAVVDEQPLPPGAPGEAGSLLSATIRVAGQEIVLLNGGPHYSLTPAASLFVACDDQEEIDRLWDALADGGTPMQCGWVTDRFGLTWQIIPARLGEWMGDPDPERGRRVTEAMLGMVKLDIPALQAARAGTGG